MPNYDSMFIPGIPRNWSILMRDEHPDTEPQQFKQDRARGAELERVAREIARETLESLPQFANNTAYVGMVAGIFSSGFSQLLSAQVEEEKKLREALDDAALKHAAEEALAALAVFKITDSEKPYAEISPTWRAQLLRAHDLLLSALLPTTQNDAADKTEPFFGEHIREAVNDLRPLFKKSLADAQNVQPTEGTREDSGGGNTQGEWVEMETGKHDLQFHCEWAVFPKNGGGSLCYCTSEERADWIRDRLNELRALRVPSLQSSLTTKPEAGVIQKTGDAANTEKEQLNG